MSILPERRRSYTVHTTVDEKLAKRLWDQMPHTSEFWGDFAGTDYEGFKDLLLQASVILEYPFGVFRIEPTTVPCTVEAHFTTWSADILNSRDEIEEGLRFLREIHDVYRVIAIVPERRKSLRRLIESWGFLYLSRVPRHFHTERGCFSGLLYVKLL